ncbi:MAG TPA: adenylate/guanylate cyclase domain-containing protein, partial [Candidatus Ozemobacteraceae bacterium]|nr:adenylate/guanylate cyclase domain-containing protein [Candidatus Ozemobacteraceae bacterium]
LMQRLSYQLFAGLLLAALLPLSLAFRLTEEFFQQKFTFLEHQQRRSLLTLFSERERQFRLSVETLKDLLPELVRSSEHSRLLREHVQGITREKPPPYPGVAEVEFSLQKLLRWFYPPPRLQEIFRCHPHLVCAVTWGDISTYFGLRESKSINALPMFFRLTGRAMLNDLNPERFQRVFEASEPLRPKKTAIEEIQQEELQRFGTQIMASIFGEDSILSLFKSPTGVLSMSLGAGTMDVFQIIAPGDAAPDQLYYLFLNTHDIERVAQRRILSRQDGHGPMMYTVRGNRPGFFLSPQTGEQFPFLRPIARKIMYTKVPISSRIEYRGQTYLVEGQPGSRGDNFIYLGVVPFSESIRREQRVQNILQLSLLLTMFISLLLALNGAVTFLNPVRTLSEALQQVAAGVFTVRLAGDRRDEIGALSLAFNQMTRSLQERHLLGQMVSVSARRAVESASAEARAAQGYRLHALILYIGIPRFERIRMATDSDALMSGLQRQVTIISRLIQQTGGSIDKIMGEKLLAVFPETETTTSEERSRRAAAILLALSLAERRQELPYPLAVGLQHGQVIAGLLGSGKRRDFTVIGSTVNLAARLEALAETREETRFLTTDRTAMLLKDVVPAEPLADVTLKGFQEKVTVWNVRPEGISPTPCSGSPLDVVS